MKHFRCCKLIEHVQKIVTSMRTCRGLRIAVWVMLALTPIWNMLIADYFNYKAMSTEGQRIYQVLLKHYEEFVGPTLFSLLVCYIVFAVLLLVFRRAWAATLISGGISLGLGLIQHMKFKLNGQPFQPIDFLLAGNVEELYSYMAIPIPKVFWMALALLACCTLVVLVMQVRLPIRWYVRIPAALLICVVLGVWYFNTTQVARILRNFNMTLLDSALQTSNYTANGMYGGFVLNLLELHVPVPEKYTESYIKELMGDYEKAEAAEDYPDYDVILILAESFFDVRELEHVSFSEDPLKNYDAIRAAENCYSGTIFTTAIGGGTARPESNVLTGMTLDTVANYASSPYYYVTAPTDSYVSNYRDAGYRTVAVHLYNTSFYSRNTAYPLIGFDEYYGIRDLEWKVFLDYTRGYATDDATASCIEYLLEQSDEGQPTFVFAITIENHQPYRANKDNTIIVEAPGLAEENRVALETYTQGVKDMDRMIGRLKAYIDQRERPTVLVLFGDHKPTLYETYATYDQLGYFDSADTSYENHRKMLSTPFLVYSNRTLDKGLFTSKSGNELSDYHLMNAVAISTGFQQTAYMEWLEDVYKTLPIYNYRLNMTNLTDEQWHLAEALELLAYDRIKGEKYSEE